MAVRISQLIAVFLFLALAAQPCLIAPVRKLWAKRRGSESKFFAFERNGRIGFIDPTGKVVIKPTIAAHIEDVGDFSNGLARVDRQGYIDETGRWVIQGDYSFFYDFSEGLVQVLADDPSQKGGSSALLLDSTGKSVAKFPVFKVGEFAEGLAPYEADGKPGVRKFEPGNFVYRDYPGLKGFIDRTGKLVINPSFAEVGPFVAGLARAVLDGYCHVATGDRGRAGTPTTGYPSDCGGAPADAVSPCMVGFINPQGSFAIQPRFESARDFQEKLAAVRVGGLWGFIDTDGRLVIPPRFEQTQSFQEGLAAVKMNGKWGFVDSAGVLTIPPHFEAVEPFSDSLAIAYSHGRAFYLDRKGQTKIAGPFREATPFVQGLAAVLIGKNHVAYINDAGKTVFDYFRH